MSYSYSDRALGSAGTCQPPSFVPGTSSCPPGQVVGACTLVTPNNPTSCCRCVAPPTLLEQSSGVARMNWGIALGIALAGFIVYKVAL